MAAHIVGVLSQLGVRLGHRPGDGPRHAVFDNAGENEARRHAKWNGYAENAEGEVWNSRTEFSTRESVDADLRGAVG
jgi:hypothetical protein